MREGMVILLLSGGGIGIGAYLWHNIYLYVDANTAVQILSSLITIDGIFVGLASVLISLRQGRISPAKTDSRGIWLLLAMGSSWVASLFLSLIKMSYLLQRVDVFDVFFLPVVLTTTGLFLVPAFIYHLGVVDKLVSK